MSARDPDDESSSSDGGSDADQAAPGATGGSDFPITRRQAIAGGAGLVALFGAGIGSAHVLRPARAVQPTVPADELARNGWVRIDRSAETVLDDDAGPITVEAVAASVQYENEGLTTDIEETPVTVEYRGQTTTEPLGDSLGSAFDRSLGVFAATKIDLTPHIDERPAGLGRAEVMDPVVGQAQDQFEQQLRDAGLENVRQVGAETMDVESGQEARFVEYRASFSFEEMEATLQGTTISIPGDRIEIAGYLAVWHTGTNAIAAAGAHPNENYADTVSETVQGEELTRTVDLRLSPSSLRDEVQRYLLSVE